VTFHDDGKHSFDDIYTAPDPRAYFSTLRKLDYNIPQLAKPYFAALIAEVGASTVVDIGSSYGINAALLKWGATMDELYDRYSALDAGAQSRAELVARDRHLVDTRNLLPGIRFVGLDSSAPALAYGQEAGVLDEVVAADLERHEPTVEQRDRLAHADLVISTGCLGYVTERTLARVVAAGAGRPPVMAHFVLRMYPFEPMAQCLAGFGYHTVHSERVFQQRRFASDEEQAQVLETLSGLGLDPHGLEADGWLYAQLFVSRPTSR
jgi:hypothetical protein